MEHVLLAFIYWHDEVMPGSEKEAEWSGSHRVSSACSSWPVEVRVLVAQPPRDATICQSRVCVYLLAQMFSRFDIVCVGTLPFLTIGWKSPAGDQVLGCSARRQQWSLRCSAYTAITERQNSHGTQRSR